MRRIDKEREKETRGEKRETVEQREKIESKTVGE